MTETERILAEFGIPSNAEVFADDIRRILARLVDDNAVTLGELQSARDIVRRSPGADARAYLLVSAIFMALHAGKASLELIGGVDAGASILAGVVRIDRRTEELSADADDLSRLVALHWPAALDAIPSLAKFVVSVADGTSLHLYFRGYYNATVRVRAQLAALREEETGNAIAPPPDALKYSRSDFSLNKEQKDAVAAAVANRLAVVTGGPGTGKTTVVCSILRALIRLEDLAVSDIALAAPTGRAAQRMGEALRKQCLLAADAEMTPRERDILNSLSGTTIHTLLGGHPPNWRHNADNPLPRRLIVIDEASMVDLLLMRSLLDAMPNGCRLVLLGDANQLPPVEAGAVLGDIVSEMGDCASVGDGQRCPFVELVESQRFTGVLRQCAEEFKRGQAQTILSPSSRLSGGVASVLQNPKTCNSCLWMDPDSPKARIDPFLREWADATGLGKGGALQTLAERISDSPATFQGEMTTEAKALFDALDSSRILTVVRNGFFGAVHANEILLRHRLGRLPRENLLVAEGIPVIVLVNSPALGLFNGDIGVTVKGHGGGMFVVFPRGDKVVPCHVSRLPEHEIAYAITVHKSQGSEFDNVLVVLPDAPGHPLLTRKMVYTAITRARKRSIIFSSRQSIESSL